MTVTSRMRTVVTAVAIAGLTTTLAPATTADAQPRPVRDVGGSYVVSYDLADKASALKAVRRAGGDVISAQSQIGLALVDADAGFARRVLRSKKITGAMLDMSIGGVRAKMATVRATDRLTAVDREAARRAQSTTAAPQADAEDLTSLQWDMDMINAPEAHAVATGKRVTVGIIDTGVDAGHPDIAPNFNRKLSRNFVRDIEAIDGPCEVAGCIDPATVDDGGHGTHVAGTVAAAANGIGITGVAPGATIVNVRAGQDSGYFFLYETVAAIAYSGLVGLDVVNMSFYTDPWLYNCDSADDYLSGDVTAEQLAEQRMVRRAVVAAVRFANAMGTTLVAAAGNQHTDLAAPSRIDDGSPDYPAGSASPRVVSDDCLSLPTEAPHVLSISSVGPSGTKADYSSYGYGSVDVAAPGGWFRDGFGTDTFRVPNNQVLSSYPWKVAVEEGLIDAAGTPRDPDVYAGCDAAGRCGVWTYLQGTSMASPHVAGQAALIVQAHGKYKGGSYTLAPSKVRSYIERTAVDHACPESGVQTYVNEGRDASWSAVCEGTTADNGLYGEGIIDAYAAVRDSR